MIPDIQNSAIDRSPSVSSSRTEVACNCAAKKRLTWLGGLTVLLCVAFWQPLAALIRSALDIESQSYLPLVPAISGYLIWTKRKTLKLAFATSFALALIPAAIGILSVAFLFSSAGPSLPVDRLSLQILALVNLFWAGCLLVVGAPIVRQLLFPFLFLIFFVPVPTFLSNFIEILLQYSSAEAAYWMLSLAGVPMIRDGLQFTLPGIPIRVAQECSGYNSTFALFLVSLVAGHLFLKSPWRRTALAVFVIPLAILRNGFRITTIASLCVYIDPSMIESYIHRKGGPIFFALSLIPFLVFLWFLSKSELAKTQKKVNLNDHEKR